MSKIYPVFRSRDESLWYDMTPKRKLIDGYEAEDNPAIWMWQAQNIGKEIPEEVANER